MKTLHLTLKKKWFDMILKGEKKEEYREIKPYWADRLLTGELPHKKFKEFNVIEFKNGYAKNAPEMTVECRGITIRLSKSKWCDDGERLRYVIKLGSILSHKNCN